jgi:hypothetical protein
MNYETRTLKIAVVQIGEQLFHDATTNIEIVDEAAGEFIEVSQHTDSGGGKIRIDKIEWPKISAAIEKMLKECRDYEYTRN